MYNIVAFALHRSSHLTFGRQTAQFKQLLAVMAIVSVAIWSIVFITMIARLVSQLWYRHRYMPPPADLPPT
jgi:hypothetical protein